MNGLKLQLTMIKLIPGNGIITILRVGVRQLVSKKLFWKSKYLLDRKFLAHLFNITNLNYKAGFQPLREGEREGLGFYSHVSPKSGRDNEEIASFGLEHLNRKVLDKPITGKHFKFQQEIINLALTSPPSHAGLWSFFFNKFIYLFIFGCTGSSLLRARAFSSCRDYSLLRCAGISLWWLLLLRSTGSRRAGSVVVPHGLSYSTACGTFLDQGSNRCPLWQADS